MASPVPFIKYLIAFISPSLWDHQAASLPRDEATDAERRGGYTWHILPAFSMSSSALECRHQAHRCRICAFCLEHVTHMS